MSETTLSGNRFTRAEVAEMINRPAKFVGALCCKGTLIPDENDPKIIDLGVVKNAKYIKKKMLEIRMGIKPVSPFSKKAEPEPKEPEKVEKKTVKKTEPKQTKPKPKVEKPVEEQLNEGLALAKKMDEAKHRKAEAEAELKELELSQKKGDLVPAGEVLPFVKRMAETKDKKMMIELMSLVKEMQAEYVLPSEFIGRFERDLILIMNKVSDKTFEEFKKEVS